MRRLFHALPVVVALGGVAALGWAWIAGWQLDVVQSGSMAPLMQRNSLAVVAPILSADVHRGDVIAFRDPTRAGVRVIHRVNRVYEQHGRRYFETKGDANLTPDSWLVASHDINGRLVWQARHVGVMVRALATPLGPVLLIGVPLAGLLLSEVAGLRNRRNRQREGLDLLGAQVDDVRRRLDYASDQQR